jgi:predicted MFS family arabinose efflux permease
LGTLAVATSTQLVFLLLSGIALALAAWTVRHPEPVRRQGGSRVPARVLLGNRKIMLGFWLIVLAAATFGGLAALVPLRLSHFGAAGVAIGGTFVVASLISALTSGPVGRLFDRRGARLPLIISQLSGAALLIALPVPSSAIGLAILTVLVLGAPITASTIPGMAVLADGAEKAGAAVAVGALLINLAWAVGETIGAPVAANLAQATSDAVPIVLLGALFLVTALVVWRTLSGAPQPSSAQRRELLFN